MTDLPRHVDIHEEGPREGFQIEPGPIATEHKIALIDALSETGLRRIQIASYVNPKRVPGWADAESVVAGYRRRDGVHYTALWLNEKGLERAIAQGQRLSLRGTISLCTSEPFMRRNQNRNLAENARAQHTQVEMFKAHDIPVEGISIMAAFGCNFAGDIPVATVIDTVEMRRQGFFGAAMLPMSELEYTGIVEKLTELEPRFKVRAGERVLQAR